MGDKGRKRVSSSDEIYGRAYKKVKRSGPIVATMKGVDADVLDGKPPGQKDSQERSQRKGYIFVQLFFDDTTARSEKSEEEVCSTEHTVTDAAPSESSFNDSPQSPPGSRRPVRRRSARAILATSFANLTLPVRSKIRQMEDYVRKHRSGGTPEAAGAGTERRAITHRALLGALAGLASQLGLKHPEEVTIADGERLIEHQFWLRIGTSVESAACYIVDWKKGCSLEDEARAKIGHTVLKGCHLLEIEYCLQLEDQAEFAREFGS